MNDLIKDADKINEKRITSEDVTTELVDGKSRLEAKKQVRLRYLDLLKQARSMEDILSVQKEINDIQEEIETVNGKINLLNHSSAMSTINFTYAQIIDASAKSPESKDVSFLYKIKSAFASGWRWVGELIVTIISIWPLLGVIIVVLIFFKRKYTAKLNKS